MSDVPPDDETTTEAERRFDSEANELPSWRISRDAASAGTWLHCLMDLPEGGTVVIKAPTLDAIRIMDVVTDNWLEAARKAAGRAKTPQTR